VSNHPSEVELQRFLRGELDPGAAKPVISHLLRKCSVCLARVGPEAKAWPAGKVGSVPASEGDYDQAIDRAIAGIALHGARVLTTKESTRRIKEALARGGLAAARREEGWGVRYAAYDALLERAWEVRFESLTEMVQLTRQACRLAARLGEDGYGPAQLADFQARAWGEHCNALRAAHRLEQAEDARHRAFEHWTEGSQDPRLHARLIDVSASLLAARREIPEALALLGEVHSAYRQLGDLRGAGKALISQAFYTGFGGDPHAAVQLLDAALELIDNSQEPQLVSVAMINRIWFLADAGQLRQARASLWQHRRWMVEVGEMGKINQAKLVWLAGHINAGLGELDRAARDLAEAREDLVGEPIAVLVALELAAVWMRQGKLAEARLLASESAEQLLALGVADEAEKALNLLRGALDRQVATAALLQNVVDYLVRAELAASGRFEARTM
jgi:hypothetical protein